MHGEGGVYTGDVLRYRKGDKVMVTSNIHGHLFEVGETVEVVGIAGFIIPYICNNGKELSRCSEMEVGPLVDYRDLFFKAMKFADKKSEEVSAYMRKLYKGATEPSTDTVDGNCSLGGLDLDTVDGRSVQCDCCGVEIEKGSVNLGRCAKCFWNEP